MFRQRSSEESSAASDVRSESEASKSATSLRGPVNPDQVVGNQDTRKMELDVKEKFSTLGNVNLGSLTKHLFSKEDITEEDVAWTWDSLFTEVSFELRSQWEKLESKEKD